MEFGKKLALLLLLSVCSNCFPSRPLNDRPSELTWQAWLLVDSQNQLQNESDRRITPKSVFIAPKLNGKNDTLPDCAEGYKSDAMGRCIPLIRVDEAAHLNFLLQKLNQLFPHPESEEFEDEEIEDESMPTAGPLQVNIPLGQDDSEDISVDASANGQFNEKINVKRHPDTKSGEKQEEVTEGVEEDVDVDEDEEEEEDGEREDYRDYDDQTEENETTTETEQTTVTDATEETTTMPTTTEEVTETTEMVPTTLPSINEDLKALFFLMPENKTKESEVQAVKVVEEKPQAVEVETIVAQTSSVSHSVHRPGEEKEQLVVIPQSTGGQFSERWKEQSPPSVVQTYSDDIIPHLKPDSLPRIEPLIFQTSPKPSDHHHKFRFPETTIRFPEPDLGIPQTGQTYYNSQETHHKPQSGELTEDQIREFQKLFIQRPPYYDTRRESSLDLLLNHRNRDRHGELFNLSPIPDEIPNRPIRVNRYPPQFHPHGFSQPKHHEMQYYGDTGQDYLSTRKRRRGGHLR